MDVFEKLGLFAKICDEKHLSDDHVLLAWVVDPASGKYVELTAGDCRAARVPEPSELDRLTTLCKEVAGLARDYGAPLTGEAAAMANADAEDRVTAFVGKTQ